MTNRFVNVALVLLVSCLAAQAETFIDFESPTYTVDTAIDGQDGWVDDDPCDVTRVLYNAALDSQVIDFSGGVGVYIAAARDLNDAYSSGKVRVTILHKNLSDRSGYFILRDASDTPVLRVGTTKDNDFYCAEGPAGTVTGPNPGGSARWIGIQIDINLDNNSADVSWHELDGLLAPICVGYALNPASTISKISLHNQKVAAMFDDIAVTVPGPTAIDFESPTYTVDTAINGQDGWVDASEAGMIRYNADLDSQVLEFPVTSTSRDAARYLNDTYSSGKVRLTILQKNLSGRSGYMILSDPSGVPVLRVGTTSDNEFYCEEGPAGIWKTSGPGGSARWIGIQIDIDLDNNTADTGWHELGGELQPLFADYVLNPAAIARISLHNQKVAAMFDDILVEPFSTDPQTCQDAWDKGYGLLADLNQDCHVDLGDVATFASKWLDCVDPENAACN